MIIQLKKFCMGIFVLIVFLLGIIFGRMEAKAADVTDSTVKILIGDGTKSRHHITLAPGEVSEEFYYEVKGYEVKSSTYASDNPDAFVIQDTEKGKCKVEAIAQGTGLVTLTILTKDGKTLKEKVFVSVYESIQACEGVTNKKADVYRCASDNSGVENNDKIGELQKGAAITITAECDDYFRYVLQEESEESSEYRVGFIKMSDVTIPITSISVEEDIYLDMGEEWDLEVEVEPEAATEQDFVYDNSNPAVVNIDAEGHITTTKRAGASIIIVSTADGLHKAKCEVHVYSPDYNAAWKDPGEDEKDETEQAPLQDGAKKPKNKFNFQAAGYTDKSIQLTWNKQKKVKRYEILRSDKKNGTYKTIKKLKAGKKKHIDKKVKFYQNYWYRLVVVKKNNKKVKSNPVKARTKDTPDKLNLRVTDTGENSVKLEWKKVKHATRYVIKRKDVWERQKEFKKIGEVGKKKKKFLDKTANPAKKYEYKVVAKRTNKKEKESNVAVARTLFKYDNNTNISLFQKDYPFVCTDVNQDINQYSVFGDYYAPVKYSYANGTLTIHLYCEFLQYVPVGGDYDRKVIYLPTDAVFSKYYKMIQDNIKERYEVTIANRGDKEYEFKGMNFEIKFVFHEKENKNETYHESQVFNEILIGGECPYDSKPGDHWYHEHSSNNYKGDYIERIYMPFFEQLSDNKDIGKRSFDDEDYAYTSAHEMGHMLGLKDGYLFEDKYDRFTDNEETGVPENTYPGSYDNIMTERVWDKYLMPNDLEMMFQAYVISEGRGGNYQAYKTNENAKTVISDCILNQFDHYDDETGRAY